MKRLPYIQDTSLTVHKKNTPHLIDTSTNLYTSQTSEVYVMSQTINWLDEDVEIYDYDGNVSYLISSRDDSSHFLNPESKFYLRSTQAKPGLMIDTVSDIL